MIILKPVYPTDAFIRAIQDILLLKPGQHGDQLKSVFDGQLLRKLTDSIVNTWKRGCPEFTADEENAIMNAVNVSSKFIQNITLRISYQNCLTSACFI